MTSLSACAWRASKPWRCASPSPHHASKRWPKTSLALTGPESEGLGLWSVLGSALPLVALLVGLTTVQWLDRQEIVSELAEIDTALLVDDLPPAAYSDPGFVQFLRQSAAENDTPSAN